MPDEKVFEQINKLAEEEHALWKKESEEGVSGGERDRLKKLEETLDQCWDLLHQRRALREAGGDPRGARVRPVEEVEGYEG
jgi:hypothetical protein